MKRRLLFACLLCLSIVALLQNVQVSKYTRPWLISAKLQTNSTTLPTIFVITPTGKRHEQKADLTRMSYTLSLVPNLHWIVIEDSQNKTSSIGNILVRSGIPYTHLNTTTQKTERQNKTRHRGVLQRNAGLDWIRGQNFDSGVVYFADDDNTYDIRLFEEMRYTKNVSVWPVGLVGGLLYEAPVVKDGKVTGWRASFKRAFSTDMAGFAISVKLLKRKPDVQFRMSAVPGYLEDDILRQLHISLSDLEPKADGCSKVLVWHTKTARSNTRSEESLRKKNGTVSIVIDD